MAGGRAEGTDEGRGSEKAHRGEHLRRAYPVSKDGTFASFLLLLGDIESVSMIQKRSG
ncbi:hypothetical protein FHS94_000013 [Sphingomonas aerophila]|uniref:Uncharacterized protein n=1 Tax=Sphingomonas aerophila TaxID=1344948 RepID=A0A7W9ESK5_9SPHN|nr:hypothetical protein [Sphingomonas aerophila]